MEPQNEARVMIVVRSEELCRGPKQEFWYDIHLYIR